MSRVRAAAAQLRWRRSAPPSVGPPSCAVGVGSHFSTAPPLPPSSAAVADIPAPQRVAARQAQSSRAFCVAHFVAQGRRSRHQQSDSQHSSERTVLEDGRRDALGDNAAVPSGISGAREVEEPVPGRALLEDDDDIDESEVEFPELPAREQTSEETTVASSGLEMHLTSEQFEAEGDPVRETDGQFDEEAILATREAEEECFSGRTETGLATEISGDRNPQRGESPDEGRHEGRSHLHALSVDEVSEILGKARAKDMRVLDVRKRCEWADQLVVASGRSSRHLRGMADALVYKVKKMSANVGPNSFPTVEGGDGEQWMVVDCGNIVIHLFLEEARVHYNVEDFWTKKPDPGFSAPYEGRQ